MGSRVFINSVEQLKLCCCRSCFSVFFQETVYTFSFVCMCEYNGVLFAFVLLLALLRHCVSLSFVLLNTCRAPLKISNRLGHYNEIPITRPHLRPHYFHICTWLALYCKIWCCLVVSPSPASLSRLLSAVCSVKQDLLVNAVNAPL